MAAAWCTKKSWTSHFNDTSTPWTDASGKTANTQQSSQFTMLPKKSPTSTKQLSRIRRGRGIVFELEPVPIDPTIDPEWDLCFNCWGSGHSHKECKFSKYYEYCRNCGRRGVNWTTCPRCAKGYIDYQKWRVSNNRPEYVDWRERPLVPRPEVHKIPAQGMSASANVNKSSLPVHESQSIQKEFPVVKPSLMIDESTNTNQPVAVFCSDLENQMRVRQLPVGIVYPSLQNAARGMTINENFYSKPNAGFYSQALNEIVLENTVAHPVPYRKATSLGENTINTEDEVYTEDDVDLNDFIVDEEESTLLDPGMSDTVQDFMNLMDLAKNLPMETQNKVLDLFVEERRLLIIGSKMEELMNGFH